MAAIILCDECDSQQCVDGVAGVPLLESYGWRLARVEERAGAIDAIDRCPFCAERASRARQPAVPVSMPGAN